MQVTAETPEEAVGEKTETSPVTVEEPAPVAETGEAKPKRNRKPRKKPPVEATVSKETPVEHGDSGTTEGSSFAENNAGITETCIQNETDKKPKRSRPRKKKTPAPETEA